MKGASSSRVFCRRQPPFRGSFPHQAKGALETMYGLSSIPAPSRMDTVSGTKEGVISELGVLSLLFHTRVYPPRQALVEPPSAL